MCFVPARMTNLHFLPVEHSIIFTPGTDDEVMHYNEVNLLNQCSLSRLTLTQISALFTPLKLEFPLSSNSHAIVHVTCSIYIYHPSSVFRCTAMEQYACRPPLIPALPIP